MVARLRTVKVPRNTRILFFFYLLKQNRVIVPEEIHASYPGKNSYRKGPKFSDRSSGQTVQIVISLLLRNRSD